MNQANTKKNLRFVWQSLNYLFWPAVCINCSRCTCENDGPLCSDCFARLLACTGGDYCRRCGRDATPYAVLNGTCPDCQGKDFYFDHIIRAGIYTDPLQKMILSFKLRQKTELDKTLSFLAQTALEASDFPNQIAFFVPVPLHWSRRLSRGYNQSCLLAKKLKSPTAAVNTDLVRIRRTEYQTQMATVASRAKNVKDAFTIRRRHKFAGAKVCLVDDIKTTGATLNECAKVLKQAGADRVFAIVLAVAGQTT